MTRLSESVAPNHKPKLGEELPIFCERCGYSLFGLPQIRCDHCEILQFHCPECGHHQPINTLRPAAQRAMGRIRALWLAWVVFFKLNFFGWLLFAWMAMGVDWSYRYEYVSPPRPVSTTARGAPSTVIFVPRTLNREAGLAFALFGLSFGMVSRMLLLRWRRSNLVGAVLAGLIVLAVAVGVTIRRWELIRASRQGSSVPSPWTGEMLAVMLLAAGFVLIGSLIVWPIWSMLARAFLPARTAGALLDWQKSQSDRSASTLGGGDESSK
jgi:hypothetical protein